MGKMHSEIKGRFFPKKRQDTYKQTAKLPSGTTCEACGAVYVRGRWTWGKTPENGEKTSCPACQRITDKYPAGLIRLSGEFFKEHKTEVLNLIRNIEALEKGERPLERIMDIEETEDDMLVSTTGIHVARRIGEALERSYQGSYTLNYEEGENSVKVQWSR